MQASLCRAPAARLHKPIPLLYRSITSSAALGRVPKPHKQQKGNSRYRLRDSEAKLMAQLAQTQHVSPTLPSKGKDGSLAPIAPIRSHKKTYDEFKRVILSRMDVLLLSTNSWSARTSEWMSFGVKTKMDFEKEAKLFHQSVERACDLASSTGAIARGDNPLFWSLRKGFVEGDVNGLNREIIYGFQHFLMRTRFQKDIAATHQALADFRFPYEWFPATRALQRTIHLHVGPTNSGKTYNALKALEEAKTGIYAGPLRLLAHEVYSRFAAKGKSCALITGEEQRIPKGADTFFRSCTVEMTPLNQLVDVAVIDEIQMIGDEERGWAWTQAVLGVQAREVHLCGEERTVDLIKALCATTGDELVVHRYNRLSPLQTMDTSLRGSFNNLEKGDCVVTFSRVNIHALKKTIEEKTGKRVAIVYGSLPPETRAQQAALFNDPNNDYDYLVASDAIGMGLNLEIKRVIFEQTHKRTSTTFRQMEISEIKQIGGRAGRFRTANQAMQADSGKNKIEDGAEPSPPKAMGLVTTLEQDDLAIVQRAFSQDADQLKTAGIQPPSSVIERFSTYFPPNTPLTYILMRLRDLAQLSPRYHLCTTGEMLKIADLIQPFPMPIYDRCVFLNAPVFLREDDGIRVLQAYAKCVSEMNGGYLLDIAEVNLELLDSNKDEYYQGKAQYLRKLETLHKSITLYLWLSYRYSGVFKSQHLAFHVKELVEARINEHLAEVAISDAKRKQNREAARKAADKMLRKKERLLGKKAKYDETEVHHEVPGEWNEPGHEEPLYQDPAELGEEGLQKEQGQHASS